MIPDLTGRYARCSCCSVIESAKAARMGFFTYLGPGSWEAENLCECGDASFRHGPTRERQHEFRARGGRIYDSYVCPECTKD